MTGGVAFEAIHQAGGLGTPLVVILNDNGMSIAPNVGALSRYFNRVRLEPGLWKAREGVEERLTKLPAGIGAKFEKLGPQLKESIKAFWAPGLFWEELDWAYMGVIDGHDVRALRRGAARRVRGRAAGRAPRRHRQGQGLLAGRGRRPGGHGEVACRQAELDRQADARAVQAGRQDRGAPQYTQVFGEALVAECERDPRVVGITAAMNSGHRPEHPAEGDARALLRRRHRRAAGAAVRGRPRAAGLAARRRDLLDLPAARLRPDRARPLPAAAARGARDGPRRPRRRRRPDAPRRVRHRLPALPAAHDADGAARRGDARAHAAHRAAPRRRAGRAPLPARRGRRRTDPRHAAADRDRHRRDPARGPEGRDRRLRQRRRRRRSARPTCSPRAGST